MRWFKGVLFILNIVGWLSVTSVNAPATELTGKTGSANAPVKPSDRAKPSAMQPELLQDQGALWTPDDVGGYDLSRPEDDQFPEPIKTILP
jgi:hypothetical protein